MHKVIVCTALGSIPSIDCILYNLRNNNTIANINNLLRQPSLMFSNFVQYSSQLPTYARAYTHTHVHAHIIYYVYKWFYIYPFCPLMIVNNCETNCLARAIIESSERCSQTACAARRSRREHCTSGAVWGDGTSPGRTYWLPPHCSHARVELE